MLDIDVRMAMILERGYGRFQTHPLRSKETQMIYRPLCMHITDLELTLLA